MELTPEQCAEYECIVRDAFTQCRLFLSEDAISDVEHWLAHAELEMAFESLCLSLRQEGVSIPANAKSVLLRLGPLLGVDQQSVFEQDFWVKVKPLLT